jgi:hypothetical protein
MTNKQMLAKLAKLKKTGVYVDLFSSREDVFSQFRKADDNDIQIVFAEYNQESYDGSATVIYYRKSTKKYYEAYGSHCSCFGLEDQWDGDEEIVVEELFKRLPVLGTL